MWSWQKKSVAKLVIKKWKTKTVRWEFNGLATSRLRNLVQQKKNLSKIKIQMTEWEDYLKCLRQMGFSTEGSLSKTNRLG